MKKETWLSTAIDYARCGYSVVPIRHKDKYPTIRWEQLTKQAANEGLLKQWAARSPLNIGIITGEISGLVVVDVDTTKGGDHEPILEKYPTDMVVRTGSGGYHLYYEYTPEWSGNRTNVVPGVDIRSNGGLVVAPPSLHASGGTYEWVRRGAPGKLGPLTTGRHNQGIALETPEDIDEQDDEAEEDEEFDTASTDKWLARDSKHGVKEGGRNDTLAKHAGYLAGKGVALDYALEQCRIFNASKFSPPLPDEEVETTVRSVYKTEKRKAKKVEETKKKLKKPLVFHQLQDFLVANTEDETRWDIEGWLPRSTVAFAVAPPGSYKTWFTFDLALSVATGTPFLGQYPVQRQGPVLLVQQEDHAAQSAERLGLIVQAKLLPFGGDPDQLMDFGGIPLFIHTEREVKFDNADQMQALVKLIKELNPVLVIVDPLYSTVDRLDDAYFDEAVQHLMQLKTIRDEVGTSFMLVHHTKKNRQGGTRLRDEMYGSGFLNAFLETGWQLRPGEDATVSCYRHFKRSKNTKNELFAFDIQNETWPYRYEVTCQGEVQEEEEPKKKGKPRSEEGTEPKVTKPQFKVNPADVMLLVQEHPSSKPLAKALKVKPTELYPTLQALVQDGMLAYDPSTDEYRRTDGTN